MANQPFVEIEQKDGGTQFKLTVDFPDNSHALLKPMRHPRSQVLSKLEIQFNLNICNKNLYLSYI